MARTPRTPADPTETFVREVDDNLRRDEMEAMVKKNGKWFALAAFIFLAIVGGFMVWQERQRDNRASQTEEFQSALNDVGTAKEETVGPRLETLAKEGGPALSASARLAQAVLALEANKNKEALAIYEALAADDDVPQPQRDLALVRAISMKFDEMTPDAVIAALSDIAKPGTPYFGTAGEMTAFAYLEKGDKARAAGLFQALANDSTVPGGIRNRGAQMASSLGLDMTGFTPVRTNAGQ